MTLTDSSFGFAQDDTWVNFNVQMVLFVCAGIAITAIISRPLKSHFWFKSLI
jgi:hypothetical protein